MSTSTSNPSYAESRRVAEAGRETEWARPSFGRELFLGRFRLDLIYPQPALDADMQARADRLITDTVTMLEQFDPIELDLAGRLPDELVSGAIRLGLLGIKIPTRYGGLGLNQLQYNRVLAAISTYSAALAVLLSAHQSVGLSEPLRHFGTEQQKEFWLPKLASDHLSAFLLTEPDVGSDPARMAASAIPTEDGTGYLVNGSKLWATNGNVAKVCVIMARVPTSEGHPGGITAFILPTDREGVRVVTRNEFMGLRGIENALMSFTDVFIPTADVIGREGKGLKIALTTLNTGRLSIPALCASAAKFSLTMAREFGVTRHQWGASVGKHDAVAQKLAFIAGSAFGMEALVDVSSRLADDQHSDVRIEAAISKLYGAELGWQVVDAMVQVRGGRGYETAASLRRRGDLPYPAEQLLRDMRVNRIFEGSSEIMRILIAREAVDQHLAVAGDILEARNVGEYARAGLGASRFYVRWLPGLTIGEGQNPFAYKEFGPLAQHLRWVERQSRRLARDTFLLMARYQGKLEQKGNLLGRVVDIGAELYATAAAVVHADTIGSQHPERRQEAIELADLFCRQARRRAEASFHELFSNDDDSQRAVALELLAGRYLWFEEGVVDPTDPRHERVPAVTS